MTSSRTRWLLTGLALLWLLVPLVPVLVWSVTARWAAPAALPQAWGLAGWLSAVGVGAGPALLESARLGLVVAALATPVGAAAGRALGWREARRPRVLALVLLLPVLLPPFAVSMGLDVLVLRWQVPATAAVVAVLVVLALPYVAYASAAGYATLDPQLEEQARTLGASRRRATWQVTLPAVRSSLLVAGLLAFLVGWSDYVVTLLLGGGRVVTLPILLGSTASGSGNDALVGALAVATLLPPVLLVLLAARLTGPGARSVL